MNRIPIPFQDTKWTGLIQDTAVAVFFNSDSEQRGKKTSCLLLRRPAGLHVAVNYPSKIKAINVQLCHPTLILSVREQPTTTTTAIARYTLTR